MLLTNHTLTGIALGLTIDDPVVLAPAALASHFFLDAIPHFGGEWADFTRNRAGRIVAIIDCSVALTIAITAAVIWPERLVQLFIGVFGATAPDLLYIPRYLMKIKFWEPLFKFHHFIQTERLWGLISEIPWALAMVAVIRAYR